MYSHLMTSPLLFFKIPQSANVFHTNLIIWEGSKMQVTGLLFSFEDWNHGLSSSVNTVDVITNMLHISVVDPKHFIRIWI
jgi:hypothetical protein